MKKSEVKAKGRKWLASVEKLIAEHQAIETDMSTPDDWEEFVNVGMALGNVEAGSRVTIIDRLEMTYTQTHPCKDCPYRRDAPLAHWSADHFTDLLDNDQDFMGKNYGCHKNDDQPCRGFLLDQISRGEPCKALRISRMLNRVTNEYMDSVHSTVPMYDSIEEMAEANFPGIVLSNQLNR